MKFIFNKAGATCFFNSPVSIIESVGVAFITNALMRQAMSCLCHVMSCLHQALFVSCHVCIKPCLCHVMFVSSHACVMFVYQVMFVTFSTNA